MSDWLSKMYLSHPGSNEIQNNLSKICLNLYISSQKRDEYVNTLLNPFLFFSFLFMQQRPPGLFLTDTRQNQLPFPRNSPTEKLFLKLVTFFTLSGP